LTDERHDFRRRTLNAQGMGRHKPAEIVALGTRSIAATAEFLGNKPFFMGSEPAGVDATISPSLPARCVRASIHRCAGAMSDG
jgi:hypothetical protein